MRTVPLMIKSVEMQADTFTPIGIYLRLRDIFPQCLLLECSDYSTRSEAFSYICLQPFAGIEVGKSRTYTYFINQQREEHTLKDAEIIAFVDSFIKSFTLEGSNIHPETAGFYGFTAYDAVNLFDSVNINTLDDSIPLLRYDFYQVILAFNHFNNTLTLVEYTAPGMNAIGDRVLSLLANRNAPVFPFVAAAEEESNMSDEQFMAMVEQGKLHCARGNVFQIVLARQFSRGFSGDDFNVYRALRSINPSPYLFYLDYLNYRIFGSSPEAHLKVNSGIATINPIAGTAVRTGNADMDKALAANLLQNPKENSEHCMLVDLARNDLSRYAHNVTVEKYREIYTYSHVVHMVSNVRGTLSTSYSPYALMASTFPAGTLSGAPKYKAIQLISKIEPGPRGIFGGAVGFIGLDGNLNHAIIIRSFLSKKGVLKYQAGAGVVNGSTPEGELAEVNSKVTALRMAVDKASVNFSN